jgi:hypothetical protein
MIKQYQNKEWLEKKYLKEKLSTGQIGELYKVSDTAIWHWLKKYDIPIRSRGESIHLIKANYCNLSQEAIEWINGELLGDGCLSSRNFYTARFQYTSKYSEYIQYISNILKSFGIEKVGEIRKRYDQKTNSYGYVYVSHTYEELLPIYNRWYPKGKKIIPKDLKLTPLICRQWHIGDGSLIHRKEGRPYTTLSTCGFTVSDVKFLTRKLINLGFKATRRYCNNVIYISTHSTKEFINYIGECPVKCYQYKFQY